MTEKYSNFDSPVSDKAHIVPELTFVKKLNLRIVDLALAGSLLVAIVIIVVLGALLASKGKESPPVPKNPYENICVSGPCLKSASYVTQNMNFSVKPCDNFFEYACGNFRKNYPVDSELSTRSMFYDMYYDNEIKIKKVLESPVERADEWSTERKLKHLFASCTDTYKKDKAGGTPFIKKILPGIGGWSVLGTFDNSTWNFQQALQKTNIDFWTSALFTFRVITDTYTNSDRRVIELDYSGMSMYWFYYTSASTEKYRTDFKNFMRTIGNYLVRDSNITMDNNTKSQRIEQWIEDSFFIESQLANITQNTQPTGDPHLDENRVTIREFTSQTNNVVDFVAFCKYAFSNAAVTENTRIIVHEPDWLKKMTVMVSNLGPNKNRMLNNYFVWRMLYRYAQEMSWDYVHANREFYVDRYGVPQFLGTWWYCFYTMHTYLGDALGSEYVRHHFSEDNKAKAHEIVDHMRDTIKNRIADNKFMDKATKDKASAKVKATIDKLGYPDFMMDTSRLDTLYSVLTVDKDDYFGNVLSINKFMKNDWNLRLSSNEDKSRWGLSTYDTALYYYNPWNELLVPAGILQFPFYDHTMPHFMTFGSLGTLVGHYLIHGIDLYGSYYDATGAYKQWWSNATLTNYNKAKTCSFDYYANQTMGPFTIPGDANPITVPVRGTYSSEGMVETSGVIHAFQAYKAWEKKNGMEKQAPGFHLSNDQMFFLSFAQTMCYTRTDNRAYTNAMRGIVAEEIRTNAAVTQMEEFQKAFNCPATSKMVAKKRCDFF